MNRLRMQVVWWNSAEYFAYKAMEKKELNTSIEMPLYHPALYLDHILNRLLYLKVDNLAAYV